MYRDERGNPELDEETGLGMDAFVRLSRERIQAEVAVFRNQIDDFIYARNTGEPSPRDPALGLGPETALDFDAELDELGMGTRPHLVAAECGE